MIGIEGVITCRPLHVKLKNQKEFTVNMLITYVYTDLQGEKVLHQINSNTSLSY